MQHSLDRGGTKERFEQRYRMGNDGNRGFLGTGGRIPHWADGGKEIGRGHVLRGQDAVHGFERKLAAAVQKVGEMRLRKAGLAGQQGDAERSALNPAQQFQAEALVHLSQVHLWKIHHQK